MAEENNDKAIATEDMELERDDMVINVVPSTKEDIDNSICSIEMESGIVDEEETDKLDDGASNVVAKEEDESVGDDIDIVEPVLVQKSPVKETDSVADQSRKNHALVIVGQNHKFNVRSRYLSNYVSSCHHRCKYGHELESEKTIRRLTLGTIREACPSMRMTSNNLEKGVEEKVNQKKDLNRRLSLPGSIPEKSPLMRAEVNNLPKNDINRSKIKRVQTEIKTSSNPSPENSSRTKTDNRSVKKNVIQTSNIRENPARKVKGIKTKKEESNCVEGEKEVKAKESTSSSSVTVVKKETVKNKGIREMKAKEPMSNSPKTPLKKSPSLKAKLYRSRRSSSRPENQIDSEEAKIDGPDDIPEKTLYMIEPNTSTKPAKKTSNANIHDGNLRPTQKTRSSKTQGSTDGKQKGSGVSLFSSSSKESSKPRRGEQQGSEVTKKTVVSKKKQIGNKTEDGERKTSSARVKSAKQIDSIREDGRSKTKPSRAKSTVEPKVKPKRKDKTQPEDKDDSAWKVKFKRGTVVALQVANNAPKKLRFKRRTSGEENNAKGEVDRKLKNKNETDNQHNDVKSGPEKVQLRHQATSEKKDDVDLNNVIEETASKLVKTRKSKVKALVGAFETVMSLRDHKQLVDTNAS